MQKHIIIVAGGIGSRMGTDTPKQLLLLNGVPVMVHTIRKFVEALGEHIKPVIVSNKDYMLDVHKLMLKFLPDIRFALIQGGATRYESVKNGLDMLSGEAGLVAIHDAVRPLTDVNVIRTCFTEAQIHGSAIAAVKSKDSIRIGSESVSTAIDRNSAWIIQTPQVFDLKMILSAYNKIAYKPEITDDASVFEKAGYEVHLVNSTYSNIKITTPEDLFMAEHLLLHR
jgi:2-C-methyl-D-erythritol 4-phosphate cytidylyltransferase